MAIKWSDLISLDPRIGDLADTCRWMSGTDDYCRQRAWYTHVHGRLTDLVGEYRIVYADNTISTERTLASNEALLVATQHLMKLLPQCHDGCEHNHNPFENDARIPTKRKRSQFA